jgi:hypothetical protein
MQQRIEEQKADNGKAQQNSHDERIITPTEEYNTKSTLFTVSQEQINDFQRTGFASFQHVFDNDIVRMLNVRLEYVLRGVYDTGRTPDKVPKLIKVPLPTTSIQPITSSSTSTNSSNDNSSLKQRAKGQLKKKSSNAGAPLGYTGNKQNIKVMQIINIHKSDTMFHQLVTTEVLGYMVSKLMNWTKGARLAQDQIWAKPPGATPLAYHRDSPYFMFTPSEVCTVWIALDDMYDELGPITYVKGSHLWNDGRVGSSQNFFESNGGMDLLYSAAERSGLVKDKNDLEFVTMNGLKAGGISIHDGRTWHGSKENQTDQPRRGIGLHFVPVDVKWTEDAMKSSLWKRYVKNAVVDGGDVESIVIDESDFPIVYLAD